MVSKPVLSISMVFDLIGFDRLIADVTALVRDETKLKPIQDKSLNVIKCNILDVNDLKKHFVGHDCILSALGSPGLTLWKLTFVLDSMKVIVDAMRQTNLKRIIIVGSQFSKRKIKKKHSFLRS
jgi:putative NADH-flavin reductase